MDVRTVKVGNKTFACSLPYVAPDYELIGRRDEVDSILSVWMSGNDVIPPSPLLISEPGFGKNTLVYECCRLCGKKLFIFQGSEDVKAEDVVCKIRVSDDPHKKWDHTLTELTTAMVLGGVCMIDEIGKIRPEGLALLISLLDERRYIDSTSFVGERITAHPGFRLIAATNPYDLEVNHHKERRDIMSRLQPVITLRSPTQEEIEDIVRTRYRILRNNSVELLRHFWNLWRERNSDRPPTPRESIKIIGTAINRADYEIAVKSRPFNLEKTALSSTIEKKHLEAAFDLFFNRGGNELCC